MTGLIIRVLGPIRVEAVPPDYRHWRLSDTFEYRLGSEDGKEFVRIHRGFETDFASIPRGLWNLFPPVGGSYLPAALVHDCIYKTGQVFSVETGEARIVERDEADRVMLEVMEVCGTGWFTRRLIYRAVRIGGRGAWAKHRRAEAVDTEEM